MSTNKKYRITNWWWENLQLNNKIKYKKIHDAELTKSKYVKLTNTIGTRISKLTESQISSINRTSGTFYDMIDDFWKVHDFDKSSFKKIIKR